MSDSARRWRLGVWVSLIVLAGALLSLAPYMTSSTEVVRMRHALVLATGGNAGFNWTPAEVPADFLLERAAPDPLFVDVVNRLGLAAMSSDWERAIVISRHLLGSSPVLLGGPIQSDLRDTYRKIVDQGQGYCGDFTQVFSGLAIAAGIPVRAWAFSFDGFGGHGHIWPEIWNRQLGRWQLLDVFDNYYFVGPEDIPLAALEVRRAMLEDPTSLRLVPLHPGRRPGAVIEAKMWDYYRRGLPEWYMVWGNNVFSYDRSHLVRLFRSFSHSLEQLVAIVGGVYPGVRILEEPANRRQVEAIHRVRCHLLLVGALVVAALLALLTSLAGWYLARRGSLRRAEG